MQMLPKSDGPLTPMQKFIGWLPLIGIGVLVFWFWGNIVPFVKETLKNSVEAGIYGGIIALVTITLWHKWDFWKMTYKNLLNYLTGWFIKMDPLSYMDRFADILTQKLKNLRQAIVKLKGEKVNLQRQIEADTELMNKHAKMAKAYREEGNEAKAGHYGGLAIGCRDSIKLYAPNMERMTRSLTFMEAMAENWDLSIDSMRQLIERKRTEWRVLKSNAAALKQSEEFLRGDTEEGRIYQESIKALEQQVSEKIALIEDFELRAKPVMEGAAMEKKMRQNEGLDFLDEYMKDENKLLMPNFNEWNVQDAEYQMVNSSTNQNGDEFKLLK